MISIWLTWIVLLLFSYILGMTAVNLIYPERMNGCSKNALYVPGIDECIWCGLAVMTVYAQAFSAVYRVGITAVIVLAGFTAVCALFLLIKRRNVIRMQCVCLGKYGIVKWCLMFVLLLSVTAWTNTAPEHYDTYLYHNQAIQWIERYGTVKGLGNLHFRFAYNSAFMPLQALFSFRGITGQSLHTVNGFVCAVMLIYCIMTMGIWERRRFGCSDFLKLAVIGYTYYNRHLLSSPGTDTMPMYLFMYICIRWSGYISSYDKDNENKTDNKIMAGQYALLCILAVYNVTLKLSVAPFVLLAVYPVYLYIKEHDVRAIIKHVILALVIGFPWLYRNYLISGYAVYPYAGIDIFDVDWKMPASVADWDKWSIQVWGRGSMDPYLHGESFFDWFPNKWLEQNPGIFNRVCMMAGIALAVILTVYYLYRIFKKSLTMAEGIMVSGIIISFVMWLTAAPLIRYGAVFTYVMLAVFMGILSDGSSRYGAVLLKCLEAGVCVLIIFSGASVIEKWEALGDEPFIMQQDYEIRQTQECQYEGFSVFIPVGTDQCGTDVFPSVPNRKMVDLLELRGDDIRDGFRVSEQYRGLRIKGNGTGY